MAKESRKLGEILVRRGIINLAQMHEALCKHRSLGRRFGEMLVDLDMVTPRQIEEGLEEQQWQGEQRPG